MTAAAARMPARSGGGSEPDRRAHRDRIGGGRSGSPFVTFGIGSRDSITLVGELEDWLGRQLKATMLFDYLTVRSLAAALGTA